MDDNIGQAADSREEQLELLRTLVRIPAPSLREMRRAAFIRDWYSSVCEGTDWTVRTDRAGNVLVAQQKIFDDGAPDGIVVFSAHMDTVFQVEEIVLSEDDRTMRAPGIGDDTANLVNLMLASRSLIRGGRKMRHGVLFAALAGEEGFGNLAGSRALFDSLKGKIRAFYSFDLYIPQCTSTAVGSSRYRITIRTKGGHSFSDFGNPNAIELLCRLIERLYRIRIPDGGRTTLNVGKIEGGTAVNAIAQKASALFEYRSDSQSCLDEMTRLFFDEIEHCRKWNCTVGTETLGVRPGGAEQENPDRFIRFISKTESVIRDVTGEEIDRSPISSDSNIPLSFGIPACTLGTVRGGGAHTNAEWIDKESLSDGLRIAAGLMRLYQE